MTRYSPISPCVGIICFRGADVLLIKRGKPPKQGQWSIPGGHIEFGEPAEAAALRELKEETGIQAELCGLVDDASHAEFISPERLLELPLWDKTRRIIEAARIMLCKTT